MLPINGACPECGRPVSESLKIFEQGKPPAYFRRWSRLFVLFVSVGFVTSCQIELPSRWLAAAMGWPVADIRLAQQIAESRGVLLALGGFIIGMIWLCCSRYARQSWVVWAATFIALLSAWLAPAVSIA
jgi:hypothetical protein